MTPALAAVVFFAASVPLAAQTAPRVRARDLGVAPGIFRPGQHNAITDVAGVTVGHATILSGDSVHTGVTAIRPHDGNLYFQRVPAAVFVGNAFGKLVGATQVRELGELETPILLTCTLCIWRAADALKDAMLAQPGMERVVSINPVVGETNDGGLNPARPNAVTAATIRDALAATHGGPVAEGSVGAGTGTQAFSWKGGIGTSSRVLPASLGGWTVGVLVQSNFGGVLQVLGAPVGRALGSYAFKDAVDRDRGDGSIMIVVATDAPLEARNLERLGARAIMGLARTGANAANGSGDYVISFSTHPAVRRGPRQPADSALLASRVVRNDEMTPLFHAVMDATEEAIYNSLFMATTQIQRGRPVEAIPLDRVRTILERYRVPDR
jgi:D-aminopeptidase